MKVSDTGTITIVGAGLAGTLLAVMLARQGKHVDLFERNPDPRGLDTAAGRSINLAIGERGRHALKTVGLLDAVDRFTIPMRGRMLHDPQGGLKLQPYGKDDSEVIYSAHRARLNMLLLDAAEATDRVRVYFNHQLHSVDRQNRRMLFTDPGDDSHREHEFEVLIGADGGGSAVRTAMGGWFDPGVQEQKLDHGYRELTIPPASGGDYCMDPNALHIWPRGDHMLIALPNPDESFTVTLFLSNSGDPGFDMLTTWPQQKAFMETHYADVVPILDDIQADFRDKPVGLLGTIRCEQWHDQGRVVLIGDAAHAVVPFHGQGMNAAFEDCVDFMSCIKNGDLHWKDVFENFQAMRIDNANAIADMAIENYLVMRESVRHPGFLLRKQLEHELERRHPRHFIARYSLVMFHRIPYAECYRRGAIQARLLDKLLQGVEQLQDTDFTKAARWINERLETVTEPV
jgi:kynurenine 3-monooxygenase